MKPHHKTFDYAKQDHNRPAHWWFQNDAEGLVLFVVFYTKACRWNRCTGCNLPAMSTLDDVDLIDCMAQIDHLFEIPKVEARLKDITKVIASNNGSMLDEATFPSTALMYLLCRMNQLLPNMTTLSLETRVQYVDWGELDFIARALGERPVKAKLELAVGFEAFCNTIRNKQFQKGLSLKQFEKLLRQIRKHHVAVRCYFMLKPVADLGDQAAVKDIHDAIEYLDGQAEQHGVDINMHLNPTYAAHGTDLHRALDKGTFTPPTLTHVAQAARHAKGRKLGVFLGLYDEGLAAPGGSFVREGEGDILDLLQRFNETQDYNLLDTILEGAT